MRRAAPLALALAALATGAARAEVAAVAAAYLVGDVSPSEDALGGGPLADGARPAAQWRNPAALPASDGAELDQDLGVDAAYGEYIAGSLRLGGPLGGSAGAEALLENATDTYRDATGAVGGTFGDAADVVGLAYAHDAGTLRLGGGLKLVQETLAGVAARPGVLADLGALVPLAPGATLSLAWRNLGSAPGWAGAAPARPESFEGELSETPRAEDGWGLTLHEFLALTYATQAPAGESFAVLTGSQPMATFGLGVERTFQLALPLTARLGYANSESGPSFPYGLGAGFSVGWGDWAFDATARFLGALGEATRLGVSWSPGRSTP